MASDPADLKAAYLVEVNKISNVLQKARATYLVDMWSDAIDQNAALLANDIISYSVGGRTITRRNASEGNSAIAEMEYTINVLIYGTISLIDNNTVGLGTSE